MCILAVIVGGLVAGVGMAGSVLGFFPPRGDGALAIAGAVIFAAGIIANAITTSKQ